jgi:hypothetical protein
MQSKRSLPTRKSTADSAHSRPWLMARDVPRRLWSCSFRLHASEWLHMCQKEIRCLGYGDRLKSRSCYNYLDVTHITALLIAYS